MPIEREREKKKETERETDRQTDRQTNKQTDRQTFAFLQSLLGTEKQSISVSFIALLKFRFNLRLSIFGSMSASCEYHM